MMSGHSDYDSPYKESPAEWRSEHDRASDDEEFSIINPFATGRSGTMRHRGVSLAQPRRVRPLAGSQGSEDNLLRRFDPYTSTRDPTNPSFMYEDKTSRTGDLHFSRLDAPLLSSSTAIRNSAIGTSEQQESLSTTPGTADFLEMEEDPGNSLPAPSGQASSSQNDNDDLLCLDFEPVRTSSGLLLTHRRAPEAPRSRAANGGNGTTRTSESFMRVPGARVIPQEEAFEMESGYAGTAGMSNPYYSSSSRPPPALAQARRLLSYVRLWNAAFCMFLLIGTVVVIHSVRHEPAGIVEVGTREAESSQVLNSSSDQKDSSSQKEIQRGTLDASSNQITEQIILVPFPNMTHRRMVAQPQGTLTREDEHPRNIRRKLAALRQEFEEWVQAHKKEYHSEDEKEKRFKIWHDNHHRTIDKNERHGPCKLTKQPVFGSNHFKDLTTEEFTSQFLTGYKGPHTDQLEKPLTRTNRNNGNEKHRPVRQLSKGSGQTPGFQERGDPRTSVERHPSVQERYLKLWKSNKDVVNNDHGYQSSSLCKWYDCGCWLRWFMYTYGYGIGGTMEPKYDGDTYPSAVDWRKVGAVTSVHSQGNCGACWAITAVETIESAYAINTGNLLDLAESEVIVCDDSCEMCNGGWPQNAYEFNIEHGGLLLEKSLSYDGDFLSALTMSKAGESDTYSEADIENYEASVCPGDNSNSDSQRYAKIKGYGYATERCICYTDGTGCDCDEQDELKALYNIATYGPATVCLEASTWQDYAGGILTSDVGCSSAFLDMNHCVQAVGYAYVDVTEGDGDAAEGEDRHSGSGSGSKDDGKREGYFIIRNQWSSSWGMYGYMYLAMGDNTCGVLNDMTQVYL